MSVCGQTEEDSASEEAGVPVREIYEQKAVSKVVRVLTVLAYLLSVSLAAILLSVYYICVWKSPELPPLNETEGELNARQGDHHDYYLNDNVALHDLVGRGDTTVSDETVTPSSNFTNNSYTNNEFSSLTSSFSNLTSEPSDITTEAFLPTQKSTLTPDSTFGIYNGTSDDMGAYNFTSIT